MTPLLCKESLSRKQLIGFALPIRHLSSGIQYVSTKHDCRPHVPERQSKTEAAVESRSYSDVAASKAPSPMCSKETMDLLARHNNELKPGHTVKEQPAVQKYNKHNVEKSASSDSRESPEDQENLGWTTVNCRHVSSLSSLHRTKIKSIKNVPVAMLLTTEWKQMVKEATDALSQQQRQQILH